MNESDSSATPSPSGAPESADAARTSALEAELALLRARLAGLESLLQTGESVGSRATARVVSLLEELGVSMNADDWPLWRLAELVDILASHVVEARNQLGEVGKTIESLAGENAALAARVDALLAERRPELAPRAARAGESGGHDDPRRRLRVLFVVHDFLPRHLGGTEIYAWRLARALSARHDVRLAFTEAHPGVKSYRVARGVFDGLPFFEVSHQHVEASFTRSYANPRMERIFEEILEEVNPDVVHVHHLAYWSLGLPAAAKRRGARVVYTLHDFHLLCPKGGRLLRASGERCLRPEPERCAECVSALRFLDPALGAEGPVTNGRERIPDRLRGLLDRVFGDRDGAKASLPPLGPAEVSARLEVVRSMAADVDLFVAPSFQLRQIFVESGLVAPASIVASDYGMDLRGFRGRVRRPSGRFRIGFVGAIVPDKGVHVFVDALNRLVDLEDVDGRVFGGLEVAPDYGRDLVARNRNPRTRFEGAYQPERIAEILGEIEVLVVPSVWWENSPLTIQEAFLAGIPVVVSDIGGMAEKVVEGRGGVQFAVGDAESLANRLRKLHDDPVHRAEVAARRPVVKSIEEDAFDMEARYRAILARAVRN